MKLSLYTLSYPDRPGRSPILFTFSKPPEGQDFSESDGQRYVGVRSELTITVPNDAKVEGDLLVWTRESDNEKLSLYAQTVWAFAVHKVYPGFSVVDS